MRSHPISTALLGAFVLAFSTSCGGGDGGGGVTGPGDGLGTDQRETGTRLVLVSGGGQTGVPGQPLPAPIVVRVVDVASRPVAGATVNFLAKDGGSANPDQARTDTAGIASTTWTLGPNAPHELRVAGTGGTQLVVQAATPPPPARVARVVVIPDSLVLEVGGTGDFNAVAYDSAGNVLTGRTVAWSSADTTVATVNAEGGVLGNAPGSVRITATVEGVSGFGSVRVRAPAPVRVARVVVEPDSITLQVGGTGDFNAIAYDSAGNVLTGRAVAWASSDTTVVTVGADGGVFANSPGTARVTATVEGLSGSGFVRVVPPHPARVARVVVTPDSLTVQVGASGDFDAVAYDSAGNVLTGRGVSWSSSNPPVATVDGSGTATGVAVGSARIVATVEGVSGSGVIHVVPPPPARVARVEVIPDSLILETHTAGDFNAVAYDSAGHVLTGRAVSWTSSDTTVAAVGADGGVFAVSPGTARISATVEGVSGYGVVVVHQPAPATVVRVEVIPDSLVIETGGTGDFDAVAYDGAGNVLTGRVVAWSSSDSTVATVGSGGAVYGVSPGTARITATVEGVSGSGFVRVRAPSPAPVVRVEVVPDSLQLLVGANGSLSAVAYDGAGHVLTGRVVAWTSADAGIATVSGTGGVHAVAAGCVRITATVEGVSGFAIVCVRAPEPTRVARVVVTPDSLEIETGGAGDFDAVAYDGDGNVLTGRAVTWTSSDSTVATVGSGGAVYGVSPGTARITATVEGVSGSGFVRVRAPAPAPVVRVEVVPDSLQLLVGANGDLDAVAYDGAGHVLTGRVVAWTSADAGIATVGSGGAVHAVAAGCVRITATVEGVSGFATVCVRAPEPARVARVVVTPDSLVLDIGGTGDFDAVAYDSNGNVLTGRTVTWMSTDSVVVTVGASGGVTGVSQGIARVTATVEGVSGFGVVHVRAPVRPLITWIEMRTAMSMGPNGSLADASMGDRLLNFWVNTSHRVGSVASIRIRGPQGTTAEGRCDAESDVYVTFRCPVYLPGRSEVGVWKVDRVIVDGQAYDYAALTAMNTPGRAFDVWGQGTDTAPPQVRTVVPQGWSAGKYVVVFGLVDHIAGVKNASLVIRGPQGQFVTCPSANASYGVGARLGDWVCSFSLTPGSGTWRVQSITATDMNGNTATYTPADIEPIRGVFEYTFITFDFRP